MDGKSYSKDDDFGSFLFSVQNASSQPTRGSETSMRIIHILWRHKEGARVSEMMEKTKSPLSDFYEGIMYLRDAGLIDMDDDDEGSTMRLSEEGYHWAQTISAEWKDDDQEDDL